jgi:Ras of Complex, Roc, domain of DAPkinase
VILCGEYGVGKTSLFRRYATNTFVTATDRSSTLGLDHFGKVFKVGNPPNVLSTPGKDLKLQVKVLNIIGSAARCEQNGSNTFLLLYVLIFCQNLMKIYKNSHILHSLIKNNKNVPSSQVSQLFLLQ